MTTGEALAWFDTLPTITVAEMIGHWRGEGIDTGHYMDGMLEAARWHGKVFDSADDGYPFVYRGFWVVNSVSTPRFCPFGFAGQGHDLSFPPANTAALDSDAPTKVPALVDRISGQGECDDDF